MQSEDFDSRIREAADNHHPSYEEKAWTKMENLLDKHLPTEKNDRRRIIFFLLLFLLLGGGAWLVINKPWQRSSSMSNISETAKKPGNNNDDNAGTGSTPVNSSPGIGSPVIGSASPQTGNPGNLNEAAATTTVSKQDQGNRSREKGWLEKTQNNDFSIMVNPGHKGKGPEPRDTKITRDKDQHMNVAASIQKDSRSDVLIDGITNGMQTMMPQKDNRINKTARDAASQTNSTSMEPTADKDAQETVTREKKEEKDVTNTKAISAPETPAKKKTAKKEKENGFSFTVSAGPDISAVGFDKTGKIKPVYGLGLNYTLSRFTIRTGFYAVKKVYTAAPTDYKPDNPLPNASYLTGIDANCKVFEIPVSIAWNFSRSKNHSWFGAAGLSSYLMKEEVYNYTYKWPGGQPVSYKWTYKNENKHIFSVLSLSAGYTRKFGKTFTFSAEPYLKLPLTGIGFGNVQLNSGGILFTLGARLTGKKK
jgi:hypothetical protein